MCFKIISFVVLAGLVLGFSGCSTLTSNLGSQSKESEARIRYLETELKRQQEENLILRQKLDEAQEITVSTNIPLMPDAKQIQTALKNAGFYQGEVDGQIGAQTKEAIKKFQEAQGLNPDGVVGSRTWELLGKYLK